MDYDLLFALCTKEEWKEYSKSGRFEPQSLKEKGYINSYSGSDIEKAANSDPNIEAVEEAFLIVIDPSRIQVPVKINSDTELSSIQLQGAFSIDAVIDRIPIKKDPKKGYSVRVKHFD